MTEADEAVRDILTTPLLGYLERIDPSRTYFARYHTYETSQGSNQRNADWRIEICRKRRCLPSFAAHIVAVMNYSIKSDTKSDKLVTLSLDEAVLPKDIIDNIMQSNDLVDSQKRRDAIRKRIDQKLKY